MVELTHDGLGSGSYSVLATGDRGGKASDALVPGNKPLAPVAQRAHNPA